MATLRWGEQFCSLCSRSVVPHPHFALRGHLTMCPFATGEWDCYCHLVSRSLERC